MNSRFSRNLTHSCVSDMPIRLRWGDHRALPKIKPRQIEGFTVPLRSPSDDKSHELWNREGTGRINGKHVLKISIILVAFILIGAITYAAHAH